MKPQTTRLSDLIKQLQEIERTRGDLPVAVNDRAYIFPDVLPWFYDGGFVFPKDFNAAGGIDYVSSKSYRPEGSFRQGPDEFVVHLKTVGPDEAEDSINGRYLRRLFREIWEFKETEEEAERAQFNGQIIRYQWLHQPRALFARLFKSIVPVKAYLDDGTLGVGKNMLEARERLTNKYTRRKK